MDILKNTASNDIEHKFHIKIPEKENDSLTLATRLLEKRREMQEIDEALYCHKEEFKMKMESCKQRQEELERKEFQLAESLKKFDKFLKENEMKRSRALHKSVVEKEAQRQRVKEIEGLNASLATYRTARELLKVKLTRFEMYRVYIEAVTERADEFSEVKEIMDRFATLHGAREGLLERTGVTQIHVEEEKQNLARLKETKTQQILHCNNELARLQSELDRVRLEAMHGLSDWTALIRDEAEKIQTCGRMKMCIKNLHRISQNFKGIHRQKDVNEIETVKQLVEVNKFMEDLSYIAEEAKLEHEIQEEDQ